ncbi:MAG: phosphatase PAP2 family protein [Candidatus Palauibacterales bacterium]|nr:phosphatase PAP2 family protein [Candidatus Palauibacterales bacterium]MDP2528497.1 phosphatase PAP2 family protein [Candidatus Palauibacterales bacterium]MDP2584034.1 phosphatase PAP2 family protein [Candidatus Palauibacterales bacterium]
MIRRTGRSGGLAAALSLLSAGLAPASASLVQRPTAAPIAAARGTTTPVVAIRKRWTTVDERSSSAADTSRDADSRGPSTLAWIGGGAAALGALVALDEPVRDVSRDVQGRTGDALARRARWFGNWHQSLPWFVGGTLAVGGVTGGGRGLETAAAVLAGAAAGSAANEVVNELVGRARPLWGRGEFSFRPLSGHASFPSGHAAYTFAMAGAIDEATDGWIPAALGYTIASATALSRVYDDKHWLSDIAVGAAIGTVVSHVATRRVLRLLRRTASLDASAPGSRPGPRAHLIAAPGFLGVGFTF